MKKGIASDPTKADMVSFLKREYRSLVDFRDDEVSMEAAIYWFANDYHGGQFSNLYSVLSTSPFRPGPICRGPEPDSVEAMLYDALESKYQG